MRAWRGRRVPCACPVRALAVLLADTPGTRRNAGTQGGLYLKMNRTEPGLAPFVVSCFQVRASNDYRRSRVL